ncbi:MAG: hypothetical protein CHACPFDD_01339 [Phycisphaerae bacterium]|nr:hypothetical protein [Phycisphaerae bacterium]
MNSAPAPTAFSGAAMRRLGLLLSIATALASSICNADLIRLKGGGTIDGDVLNSTDTECTIRSLAGVVRLPRSAIESIEPGRSVFAEYDSRRQQTPDQPDPLVALAAWCEEQGLTHERLIHLRRALELSPDHAAARRALGFARVGDLWVDARSAGESAAKVVARAAERAVEARNKTADEPAAEADPERAARAVQATWFARIRAVKSSLLDSGVPRLEKQGRERIREINDPLAIVPLVRTLSTGDADCRLLLVEMLGRLVCDESTMNLAVVALVDPRDDVRSAALSHLEQRSDERVVAQFRKALGSGDDALIRRAATGLGRFRAASAVPELIRALTANKRMRIETPVQRYFHEMPAEFREPTRIRAGGADIARITPEIGFPDAGAVLAVRTERRLETVTVFRTEVLEALKVITGQNLGFDEDVWQRWYEENRR